MLYHGGADIIQEPAQYLLLRAHKFIAITIATGVIRAGNALMDKMLAI